MTDDAWKQRRQSKDDAVCSFIVEYTRNRGYPPTVREVGDAFGWTSSSTVHARLERLKHEGKLLAEKDRPRTLRVVLNRSSESGNECS